MVSSKIPSTRLHLAIALIVMACPILMMSCSGSDAATTETTADSCAVPDTVAVDGEPTQESDPDPYIHMPDTESQLEFMRSSGYWDRYASGILPKMAQEQPDYCERLLNNKFDRFIIVDKGKMKVFLYDRFGNIEKKYGMACAKNFGTKHKKGDSRTPEGFFSVEGRYNSTDWLFTDDDGVTSPKKGQFGPRFIRLLTPGTRAIGIHGTCAPWSIGGRSSHGCIRLTNDNIMELVDLVETGMPVIVSPGTRDMLVNHEEGFDIPSVTTEPGGRRITLSNAQKREAERRAKAAKTEKSEEEEALQNEDDRHSELPETTPADSKEPEPERATEPESLPEPDPALFE